MEEIFWRFTSNGDAERSASAPREIRHAAPTGRFRAIADDQRQRDDALRPRWLREVIGQKAVVQRLEIVLNACRKLKEPLAHILFDGPPGLGKTTFATVLPNELGTSIQMTSGPALTKPKDLMPFLTNAEEGSILFIDEIHRMPRVVEEFIYPAMEDFRIDIVLGEGINARTLSMPLKHFTLIGATTRSGMLSSPMRDRFKMHEHLDFYTVEELAEIIRINARKLQTAIAGGSSPGTGPAQPRHAANRQRPPVVGPQLCHQRSRWANYRWTWPRRPWPWPRSIPRGWTSRTAVTWKR